MMKNLLNLFLPTILVLAALAATDVDAQQAEPRIDLAVVQRDVDVSPGSTALLGVLVDMEPGWHLQAGEGSGDEQAGLVSTTVKPTLPEGWTLQEVIWPDAHAFTTGQGQFAIESNGYEGRFLIAMRVNIPASATPGEHTIKLDFGYQTCDDQVCLMPTTRTIDGTLVLASESGNTSADIEGTQPADIEQRFRETLGEDAPNDASGVSGGEVVPPAVFLGNERIKAQLFWRRGGVVPGEENMLGILVDIAPNWHIQAGAGSGDESPNVIPTTITLHTPEDWSAGAVRWPEAHDFTTGFGAAAITAKSYEGRTLFVVPVKVPKDASDGTIPISATIGYQACDPQACEMPTSIDVAGEASILASASAATTPPAPVDALFEEVLGKSGDASTTSVAQNQDATSDAGNATSADASSNEQTASANAVPTSLAFFGLLLAAALGGFLLNLTPCVLPVIPLKIMGLSQSAGSRARTLALGLTMCAGIIAFWLAIGTALASLNNFTAVNQLYQYPIFPISLGVLIAILAIGMCGMFSISLPKSIYAINPSHDSFHGSFAFGIMTAVLSTPCTAPFMGGAAATAVGQGTATVLVVFMAIGAGMALPYAVLASFPQLVAKMPRTGPASELVKQVMGLLMLAAAAYFIGVGLSGVLMTPPDPPSRAYWWPVAALIAIAGGWLAFRTYQLTDSSKLRGVFGTLGGVGVLSALYIGVALSKPDTSGPIRWVYYTPERLDEILAEGNVAVVDFTAEWCLNCKFLEKSVLMTDAVSERLNSRGVVPIKVDLTGNNAMGSAFLSDTGSVTIPWLVILKPDGDVAFAANWYTADQVLDAIDQAHAVDAVASRK